MEAQRDITADWMKPNITKNSIIDNAQTKHTQTDTAETTDTTTEDHTGIDHPLLKFVDFAVNASAPLCISAGLASPDLNTYQNFARDAVNKAAWDYLPVTDAEDTPKWLGLLIAIGALAAVFAPTAMSAIEKAREQEALQAAQQNQLQEPAPDRSEEPPRQSLQEHQPSPAQRTARAPSPQATAENTPKIHFDTDPGQTIPTETINPTP